LQLYDGPIGGCYQYFGVQTDAPGNYASQYLIFSKFLTGEARNISSQEYRVTGSSVSAYDSSPNNGEGSPWVSVRRAVNLLKFKKYSLEIRRAESQSLTIEGTSRAGDWFDFYFDGTNIGGIWFERRQSPSVPLTISSTGGTWTEYWPNSSGGTTVLPVPLQKFKVWPLTFNGSYGYTTVDSQYSVMPNSDTSYIPGSSSLSGFFELKLGGDTPRCTPDGPLDLTVVTTRPAFHYRPGPLDLSGVWGVHLWWALNVEEDSPVTTSMVVVDRFGVAKLSRTTGTWTRMNPLTPYGGDGRLDQRWIKYAENWGTRRGGMIEQSTTGLNFNPVVDGYSVATTQGMQFGQMLTNSDGSPGRLMTVAYGGLDSSLASSVSLRQGDLAKNQDVLGLMWWVEARVIGPDDSNSFYRLVSGVDLLGFNDWSPNQSDGYVGRARQLGSSWKWVVGTTLSSSMIDEFRPDLSTLF
jgi:hypothetical protein